MEIETKLPQLDNILGSWKQHIGQDFEGYKNHCYRMLNFCFFMNADALGTDQLAKEKFTIAAGFHDLGLWLNENVNYLPLSARLAERYLINHKRTAWLDEIRLMINLNHNLNPCQPEKFPLVEIFRKADLADFSLGMLTGGVSASFIHQVRLAFPNAGFHKMLMREQLKWFSRNDLNPVPVAI